MPRSAAHCSTLFLNWFQFMQVLQTYPAAQFCAPSDFLMRAFLPSHEPFFASLLVAPQVAQELHQILPAHLFALAALAVRQPLALDEQTQRLLRTIYPAHLSSLATW